MDAESTLITTSQTMSNPTASPGLFELPEYTCHPHTDINDSDSIENPMVDGTRHVALSISSPDGRITEFCYNQNINDPTFAKNYLPRATSVSITSPRTPVCSKSPVYMHRITVMDLWITVTYCRLHSHLPALLHHNKQQGRLHRSTLNTPIYVRPLPTALMKMPHLRA